MQFSTSCPGQLAADGEPSAGVCHRHWWSASVSGDVRSDVVQGQTPTTNSVHCRLRLQQRMVNHRVCVHDKHVSRVI